MVARNHRGQGMTEYILMLALLTLIGIYFTKKMVGSQTSSGGGAVGAAYQNTARNIAMDEKR